MPSGFKSATGGVTGQLPLTYKIDLGAKIPRALQNALRAMGSDKETLLSTVNTGGRSIFVADVNPETGEPQFLNAAAMTDADRKMVATLLNRYQNSMQHYVAGEDETKGTVSYVGQSSRLYMLGDRAVVVTAKPKDYEILLKDVDAQMVALDRLTTRLGTDPVIDGLPSKEVFALDLKDLAAKAERAGHPYALIKFDIDRFKDINDIYSHDEADKILRQVAAIVKEEFPGYKFGRTGGDEFSIFVPECESPQAAAALAERLRLKIKEGKFGVTSPKGQKFIPITLSLGAAFFDPSANDRRPSITLVSEQADRAMSKAKGGGRVLWSLHGDCVWYVNDNVSLKEFNRVNHNVGDPLKYGLVPTITTFEPYEISRLVINDIVAKFKNGEHTAQIMGYDQNDPVVQYREKNIRNAAALIQAGARGLLSVEQREGVFLPVRIKGTNKVKKFVGEPDIIQKTQQRYTNIYISNPPTDPTRRQRFGFLRALSMGADVLAKEGCTGQAEDIRNYVNRELRRMDRRPTSPTAHAAKDARPAVA